MQAFRWAVGLSLGAMLTACVPVARYNALERENQALSAQVERDRGLEQSRAAVADRATALAQQNVDLKMDRAAMRHQASDKQIEYEAVTRQLQKEVDAGDMRISRYQGLLTMDVADEILFDSAKADLKPRGDALLVLVGKALLKGDKTIRVVGHTDDQPLAKGAGFDSNWELSTARATTVVRFLQDRCGIQPERLLASGRGQWMPVASNSTPEGRRRNRRIQIMLVDKDLLNGSEGL